MAKFKDIKEFVSDSRYAIDTPWDYFETQLRDYTEGYELELNPDFQRGHVWTSNQQIAYIEYVLQGGPSGKDLYFNCERFNRLHTRSKEPMVLVDGKQRIEAVRAFFADKIPVFGSLFSEYEDRIPMMVASFRIHVNTLESRAAILRWYLLFNAGGTPHTKEEIERVTELLRIEEEKH